MKDISHDFSEDINGRFGVSEPKLLKNFYNYEENLNNLIEEILSGIYDHHLYENKYIDISSYEKNV